jgi:hypothetical protein
MSDSILAFITAKLDERERVARAATSPPWWDRLVDMLPIARLEQVSDDEAGFVTNQRADAAHIVLNDPAQIIRDVAADRAILAEVQTWKHDYNDSDPYYSCSQASSTWQDDRSPGSGCDDEDRAGKPCDCGVDQRRMAILTALAQPFAAHNDFDPAWRP